MDKYNFYDNVFLKRGEEIYNNKYISSLREDVSNRNNYIIPNEGHQEMFLTTKAQIAIYTGVKGAGKTSAMLMSLYPYTDKEFFAGVIFRKEKNDASATGGIADESKVYLKQFGTYKSSFMNMNWSFISGGSLKFEYYSDAYKDFVKRFQGKELCFIGWDEITQVPFKYFCYMFSDNRNPYGYRNIIRGTCNPDGDSWVYDFLKGEYRDINGNIKPKYINDIGAPVAENNGKILYFFKYGDRPDECFWGETKEDVYMQGKNEMDSIYYSDPNYEKYIKHPKNLALSFTLISGTVSDNKAMMDNGGEYVSKLSMMSKDDLNNNALGLWTRSTDSETLVSSKDMASFFHNPTMQISDFRCITADMSGSGKGDAAVLFYWEGFHLVDCEYLQVGAETLKLACDKMMEKYNIKRDHFCYDATGLGSTYEEYFKDSVKFIAGLPAFDKKTIYIAGRKQDVSNYKNVRGQVFDELATRIRAHEYSIDEELLHKRFGGKMLIDHFREEYPVIARVESNQSTFQAMEKKEMKRKIGHSPNIIDCWTLREYINLYYENCKKTIRREGAYLL